MYLCGLKILLNSSDMAKKTTHDIPKLWELNPVWDVLTHEEKFHLDLHSKVCTFRKNEIVHLEGDMPTHMMMLVSGTVRVYKEGIGNRTSIIRMLKPYDFFGYRAIIANETYNTNVSCCETSEIYLVERDIFMRLIQENNQFCYLFLTDMAKDLGGSDTRSVNIGQKHIRGRLAETLLYLKDTYGLDDDKATISMYMSREDLANLSNMTTSNAIRTLSSFGDEGIISTDGRKIKILDLESLEHISHLG